jgi:hypothetical protein
MYWDGVERAMATYPQMFRTWTTKHVSGFCGVNRRLSRIEPATVNVCPCCGNEDESAAHLTRCPDPGRQLAFAQSVDSLLAWMSETHADENMISCLAAYLRSIGEGSMVAIARPYPHL